MKQYLEKCKNNLFEHSIEKNEYNEAIKEWYFLDEVIDNNEFFDLNISKASCELCEHEDLRWQFVIYNSHNTNQLKVGSSCIKQFNVALLDKNGNKIFDKERNSKINKLINFQRIKSSNKITFQLLTELCKIKKSLEINNMYIDCWTQLKINGNIEPKMALFLINNFIECKIDYSNMDLKIDLQRKKCNDQLSKMSNNVYLLLRPYISSKKQNYYDKYFEGKL